MSTQMSLHLPFPAGHCERIRWTPELWPKHIQDSAGVKWLVLHIGPPKEKGPAQFLCHKPKTVEYHAVSDVQAFPA